MLRLQLWRFLLGWFWWELVFFNTCFYDSKTINLKSELVAARDYIVYIFGGNLN